MCQGNRNFSTSNTDHRRLPKLPKDAYCHDLRTLFFYFVTCCFSDTLMGSGTPVDHFVAILFQDILLVSISCTYLYSAFLRLRAPSTLFR